MTCQFSLFFCCILAPDFSSLFYSSQLPNKDNWTQWNHLHEGNVKFAIKFKLKFLTNHYTTCEIKCKTKNILSTIGTGTALFFRNIMENDFTGKTAECQACFIHNLTPKGI